MIDVGKFAKPIGAPGSGGRFTNDRAPRFGIASNENAASILRAIADDIEAGHILLQKVQGGTIVSIDEWFTEALYLEFAPVDKVAPAPEPGSRELYGPGLIYPVAISPAK